MEGGLVEKASRPPAEKEGNQPTEDDHAPTFEQAGGFEQAQIEPRSKQWFFNHA